MKKIWPWLLLLLLLIIFCVWSKKDSMHVSSDSTENVIQQPTIVSAEKHYINYEIVQKGKNYVLNGNFTDVKQQNKLKKTSMAASKRLQIKNTSTNQDLIGDEAITLTNKILPHFIKHYKNGKIVYSNQTLRIYGKVNNYEAQHEMQRLLNTTTLASQDNSTVVVEKPVHFLITKKGDNVIFKGLFNDKKQSMPIQSILPSSSKMQLSTGTNLIDNGAINTTKNILSPFMKTYTDGTIEYKNKILTVSGMVANKVEQTKMHKLFTHAGMKIVDHTTIDTKALARAKADAEVKRKAQEANAKRLALSTAAKKAKDAEAKRLALATAAKKAKDAEAKRLALATAAKKAKDAEAKRKAQEAADKKAKDLQEAKRKKLAEAKAAKRNIINLLKIQNIEFEVAKGSLTPQGKGTVDKLANILKQYPHINIEIAGHTDSDGSAAFNQRLSQSRVDTVKKRLVSKGISRRRLTAKGYGESQPLVPNTSDANKQRNRRVEINIQKNTTHTNTTNRSVETIIQGE